MAPSESAAAGLANYQGTLSLDGLTTLSDGAAAGLGKHQGQGRLELHGLQTLTDGAAAGLGNYKGELCLTGLCSLSDAAAAGLAKHQGSLNLSRLTSLSDGAAFELSKHQGVLDIRNVTSLSKYAAIQLAKLDSIWVNDEVRPLVENGRLIQRARTALCVELAKPENQDIKDDASYLNALRREIAQQFGVPEEDLIEPPRPLTSQEIAEKLRKDKQSKM